jgi:phosphoribosylamine-glycine ligase
MAMNVLVIGSGGREHALAARLQRSASVARVVVCPGNGGIDRDGLVSDAGDPIEVAQRISPDLVVIGPKFRSVTGWPTA